MATDKNPNTFDIDEFMADITKADPLAEQIGNKVRDLCKGLGVPWPFDSAIPAFASFSVYFVMVLVALVVFSMVGIGSKVVLIFLKVLTKIRTQTVPTQVELSASVLSEFLATEITAEQIKQGKTGDATIDAARGIGNALLGRLTKEFVPQGTVTPESGEEAAKVFAGYGVNFAVQNEMIGTIADATSFHFLEDFRELGVEVARNIGLGRLVRQALMPLVRNAVAEPYDQALRKRYRPDRLSDAQYVRAWIRGGISFSDLQDRLAIKGFKDEDIAQLIVDLTPNLSDAELSSLVRYGDLTSDGAVAALVAAGIPADMAKQKLRVNDIARTDSLVTAYKSLIAKQRIGRLIDEDGYNKLLDRLPITDEERQLERNYVGQSLELPQSFLPWSEVKKAFELGAVDLDYVDRWLEREGFSDEDSLVRELLLFDELGKKLDKAQAAADKASRKVGQKPQ